MTRGSGYGHSKRFAHQRLRFKAENEDGVVLECEALLMFDSPFFGKSYIVYTDGGTDEDGFTNVYASSYNKDTLTVPEGSEFASIDLSPIEDDEEWSIIRSSSSAISRRRAVPSRKTARTDPADHRAEQRSRAGALVRVPL